MYPTKPLPYRPISNQDLGEHIEAFRNQYEHEYTPEDSLTEHSHNI